MSKKQQMLNSMSEEATRAAGRKLAQELQANWGTEDYRPILVLLSGDYGVGKTQFVKGFAVGLGVQTLVTSPSYTYMQEYSFDLGNNNQGETIQAKLVHVDAWRVNSFTDLELTGIAEFFKPHNMVIVEWGNKFSELKNHPDAKVIEVTISEPDQQQSQNGNTRNIQINFP